MTTSLSGRFSLQGGQALQGAKLWATWANRQGGLLVHHHRKPIKLVYYDDESSTKVARRLTQRLITKDKVDILLGPYSSALTLAVAPIAEAYQTVLWNHGGATDTLHEQGFQWVVSILAPASSYFHGFLDMVHELDSSASKVAILWSGQGSFGAAVASGAKTRTSRLGFKIVLDQAWEPPLTDARSFVDSLQHAKPDLILAAGALEDELRLAKGLLESNFQAKAIGLVAAGVAEFGKRLGKTAHGFLGPSQWEPRSTFQPDFGPTAEEFIKLLQETNIQAADYPAAQAFAAGLIVQKCLEASQERLATSHGSRQWQLKEAAGTLDFTTFYGQFRIDPATGRQVGHRPVIVQWQEGPKRVVWPRDSQQVGPLYPCPWYQAK